MKKFFIVLAIALVFSTLAHSQAFACKCLPQTNAEHYCGSDFAIRGRVVYDYGVWNSRHFYLLRVQKTFKGSFARYEWVSTPTSSAACGVTLKRGTSYLLTGSDDANGWSNISSCDKVEKWRKVSRAERAEWAAGYSCQASCPVGCDTWYDGCNTCRCEDGKVTACTKRYCYTKGEAYCKAPCPMFKCAEPPKWCPSGYALGYEMTDNGCRACETCLNDEGNALSPMYCYTREMWSDEKREWCCEHKSLGCPASECQKTGCSGQVCAEEPVNTTCEWRPEYACYQNADCARQANGACGWTQTSELQECLDNAQ